MTTRNLKNLKQYVTSMHRGSKRNLKNWNDKDLASKLEIPHQIPTGVGTPACLLIQAEENSNPLTILSTCIERSRLMKFNHRTSRANCMTAHLTRLKTLNSKWRNLGTEKVGMIYHHFNRRPHSLGFRPKLQNWVLWIPVRDRWRSKVQWIRRKSTGSDR